MATINERILDRTIAHQQNVINFSRSQASLISNKLNGDLSEIKKEVLLFLSNYDGDSSRLFTIKSQVNKIDSLIIKLKKIRSDQYGNAKLETNKMLKGFIKRENLIQESIMSDGGNINYDKTSNDSVWTLFLLSMIVGSKYEDHFRDLENSDIDRVSKQLRFGLSQNLTDAQIMKSIFGTKQNRNKDGVINTSFNQLSSTISTLVIAAQTATVASIVKANIAKVIWGQFVAVLDSRTSAICSSYSGLVAKYVDMPNPPLHPNCRSHITIFYKTLQGFAKKDLGAMPRVNDYFDWITTQPKVIQEQALGVKRTELLRSGKLTVDKFYANNELITLDELQRRYGDIFKSTES
tara:strand:+ start:1887 stop:2936 length:1050 start_codon:yes stop_codon:yes gene_type:complete